MNDLQIGKYTLSHITVRGGDKTPYYDLDQIHIQHESGEGMSTDVRNVERLIDGFYQANT